MDNFKRGANAQGFGHISVRNEARDGGRKLRMSRSKSPEATEKLVQSMSTNDRGQHRRNYAYRKDRKDDYSYSSRSIDKDPIDTAYTSSRLRFSRSRTRSPSFQDLTSTNQTEPQLRNLTYTDRNLLTKLEQLRIRNPRKIKSNPGNLSSQSGIVEDLSSPEERSRLPSPPPNPLELHSEKQNIHPYFKSPARVNTCSSISDSVVSNSTSDEGAAFSECGSLSRTSSFAYSVPNSSDSQLDKPESILSSVHKGGLSAGSMSQPRRRSHWWKIKAQLNVLRALNPSISEENVEVDSTIATEDFINTVTFKADAVTEETQNTNDRETEENALTEQTPTVKIETPLEDNTDISVEHSGKSFIDDLVKDSPVYQRSTAYESSHLTLPVEDSAQNGRSLSINTERSYSSAATSDLSPSECSICAPKSAETEFSNDKKVVLSLYLDTILTGVVDQIMDELSDVIKHNGSIQNYASGSPSRTASSETNNSAQSDSTATPGNHQSYSSGRIKRPLSNSREGSPDEGDGQFPNKQRKLEEPPSGIQSNSAMTRKLACPFSKRFPSEYASSATCSNGGWDSVHRVKGHLYRTHRLPIHCNRCFLQFKDEDELKKHQRSEERCVINNNPPILKGFNSQQEKFLRSRKGLKGKDEAARWIQIYMILFPDVGIDIPDPFIAVPKKDDENKVFEEYLQRHVRGPLKERLEESVRENLSGVPEDALPHVESIIEVINNAVPTAVRDIIHNCFEQFREQQIGSNNGVQDRGAYIPPDIRYPGFTAPTAMECLPVLENRENGTSMLSNPGSEALPTDLQYSTDSGMDSGTQPDCDTSITSAITTYTSADSSIYLPSDHSNFVSHEVTGMKMPITISSPEEMRVGDYGGSHEINLYYSPVGESANDSHTLRELSLPMDPASIQKPGVAATMPPQRNDHLQNTSYTPMHPSPQSTITQTYRMAPTVALEDLENNNQQFYTWPPGYNSQQFYEHS